MSSIVNVGDKLLISHRRLFQGDEARFFVGTAVAYEDGVIKIAGHTFWRDFASGQVSKKADVVTRLYSLSGSILVYQLPDQTRVDDVKFENIEGNLFVTDGADLRMNLSERTFEAQM